MKNGVKAMIPDTNGGYILTSASNQTYYIASMDAITPLGKGGFGVVFKAKNSKGDLKVIKKADKSLCPYDKMVMEYNFMKDACQYKDAANLVYAIDYADDDKSFYIVMEYYNEGNLTRFINKNNIDNEQEIIEYFRQICYGVMILHQNNVIHRDLNPLNVFVTSYIDSAYPYKHFFVIGDLGLSRALSFEDTVITVAGVDEYLAPEVKSGNYDTKADVYSLGCILYFMLTKKAPFSGFDKEKEKQAPSLNFDIKYPISDLTIKILEGCLKYGKNDRIDNLKLFDFLDLKNLYSVKFVPVNLGDISKQKYISLNSKNYFSIRTFPPLCKVETSQNKDYLTKERSMQVPYLKVGNISDLIKCIKIEVSSISSNKESQIMGVLKLLNRISDVTTRVCSPAKYILASMEKALKYKYLNGGKEIIIPNELVGSISEYFMLGYIIWSCNNDERIDVLNSALEQYDIGKLPKKIVEFTAEFDGKNKVIKIMH